MGWFDEQIRQRQAGDQQVLEDSMLDMASAVLGGNGGKTLRDRRTVSKTAVDRIMKYHHFDPPDIPEEISEPEEQLEYALREHGMASRRVSLTGNWYRTGFGPMLAFRRDDGMPVALLPRRMRGYAWVDADGRRVRATRRTAAQLEPDAICVYPALPRRPLGVPDLLAFMKNCIRPGDWFALISLTLLATGAGLLLPRLTKLLTGYVLDSGSGTVLAAAAVFLACALISSALFTANRAMAVSRIQTRTSVPLEAAVMLRLLSLPAPFFRQFSSGGLASRTARIAELCTITAGSVLAAGTAALASLLYLGRIRAYAPALFWPVILILALSGGVIALTLWLRRRQMQQYMAARAAEAGVSFALISGIQKIRLAGAEKRAFARWAGRFADGARAEFQPSFLLKISSALSLGVSLLGTAALYYFAVRAGTAPPDYMAFAAAYGALTGAFTPLYAAASDAAQIRPILEMAEPVLKAAPETAERREHVRDLSGAIELSGVWFRYEGKQNWILRDLDLKIRPGEYVAVTGGSDCGQSTLLRLLLGFETPERGAVYYDRRDLSTLDLGAVRRCMGVVTQDGSLFQGDIYSNITVTAPHLSMEEVWAAAEIAGIADDIRAMPMGMHTVIGEGQGGISGGQRQRLLIARAVASRPRILLFDEATSALDNKTQKQVADALAKLDCTRIVIAHRLSTVRDCDRILVLGDGHIAEQGTYDELIAKGGLFAGLVERQRVDL